MKILMSTVPFGARDRLPLELIEGEGKDISTHPAH